ncbi:MAG: hypothetical protein M0R06_11135 [Sphaerochaeta sp.]|jgi:hypothetical protein|nr:hypothetical protein [Sphaerochaeta sp.]
MENDDMEKAIKYLPELYSPDYHSKPKNMIEWHVMMAKALERANEEERKQRIITLKRRLTWYPIQNRTQEATI